jgi:NADH dehydrogenase FAD-containing subunit
MLWVYAKFLVPRAWQVLCENIRTRIHRLTYRAVPNPKNIVVIGGSFGGIELTRKLASSLTTGYRVVLVEKNSHFNYTFNFPRYSVLQGHEHLAFIPYDGTAKGAPAGIYRHVRGEASSITKESVQLASGEPRRK